MVDITVTGEVEQNEVFCSTIWRTQQVLHSLIKGCFRRLGWLR